MNARYPFSISVRDLKRQPGAIREVSRKFVVEDQIGTPVLAIVGGIFFEGNFESAHEGILVTGTLKARAEGQCSRCLKDTTQQVDAEVQELYLYPEHIPHSFSATEGQEADSSIIKDNCIDLGPLVRSELVLQLPFTPLCDDGCLGICAKCGQNLRQGGHAHDSDDVDPHWETLKRFKF